MEADKEIQEKLKKLFFILIGKVMLSGKYAGVVDWCSSQGIKITGHRNSFISLVSLKKFLCL